jgi:hypothetical protein
MSQESLSQQLLRDILNEQRSNAQMLGRIDQTVADMKDRHETAVAENKAAIAELDIRVHTIEVRDWKRTGFFAGILFVGDIVLKSVIKKLGW